MINKLFNSMKWSNQSTLTKNFIGKSYFLISLLPIAMKLFHLFDTYTTINTASYKIIFLGALIFVVGYTLSFIFTPNLIRQFPQLNKYIDDCISKCDIINIDLEFSTLSDKYCCAKYESYDKVFLKLKDYLPFDETLRRVQKVKAVSIYSRCIYQINDYSLPLFRTIIFGVIITGLLLMNLSMLLSIIKFLGDLI